MDLNADVGESFGRWRLGDDDGVLAVVTSANIACGFHAGDPLTLRRTCASAVAHDARIGAQVGYRDLAGFGRRYIAYDRAELTADVLYQLGALDGIARAAGSRVSYVKPHGALYNTAVHDETQAAAVVDAITAYDDRLPLLGLPGSALLAAGERAGLRTVREAFADRGYTAAGTLVPRSEAGALVTAPDQVAERVLRLVEDGTVLAVDGTVVPIEADSVCVHGDSPDAVVVARAVRERLAAAGATLRAFA